MRRWTKEEVGYLKKNYGKLYTDEIAKNLNTTQRRVIHKAHTLGLKSNLTRRHSEDILAKINQSGLILLDSFKNLQDKCRFKCCYCSKVFTTTPYRVSSGHTKSCGCVSLGKRKGGKYVSKTFFQHLKNGAISRNLQFDLSINFLDNLLEKQNFSCSLSGINLKFGYIELTSYTASLDRIDSSLGYIEDNVQWVHKMINMAKQGYSQKKFIEICKLVTEKNS